jgi:acetoin utilization deacetylase AcuC-like enzyme
LSTGFFTHRICSLHDMGSGHPERPERLSVIRDRLLATGLLDALQEREAPAASKAQIERAHTPDHIARLAELNAQVQHLSEKLVGESKCTKAAMVSVDPDTQMNRYSLEAALHAAGAAVAATDAVLAGELANAFCSVRPPGHHATSAKAMGFCLYNNVAIAAKHALDQHGLKRVAVVDFDVHHGNGTEDIAALDPRMLMVGFFQHPFYPYSGSPALAAHTANEPVPIYTRGQDIREVFNACLAKLDAFKPEMLFISAGFDAHRDDDLGQLGLNETDYAWMTEQLMALADKHAKGRVVSCLEGGYNLNALARSVEAHVRVLARV